MADDLGRVRSTSEAGALTGHPDVPMVEAQFDGRLRGTMLVALNSIAVD